MSGLIDKKARAQRPTDGDRAIGAAIRERRILMGLTQHDIAEAVGVTYQQIHKIERGINRISAGRVIAVARALSCPVASLFERAGGVVPVETPRERMTLELVRNFARLSPASQDSVAALVRGLADQSQPETVRLAA